MFTPCIIDNEKIDLAVSSLQDTEKTIIQGSDEHLDAILLLQASIAKSTESTRILVDSIESNFNKYTAQSAQSLVAKIFPIFALAKHVKEVIKEMNFSSAVKSQMEAYDLELNELFEITNDLSRYKGNVTTDYNALFND